MKHKVFVALLLLTMMSVPAVAQNYDFTYTYQGQTLYYSVTNSDLHQAEVVNPVSSDYYSYVSGSLVIPDSVENSVGEWFAVTSIGTNAFRNCTGLTSVTIPNTVTTIGYQAFYGCTGLTSVTIPSTVTSIGNDAFLSCSGLTSITVDNGNIVYDSRNNCNAIIKSATNELIVGCRTTMIPNTVTSIGGDAFFGCTGLTSVTIPNSVTSIGTAAFCRCYGLTAVTIPSSVDSIGMNPFADDTNLTSIVVASGNSVYDSRGNCNAIIETSTNALIVGCRTTVIPNTITMIKYGAFNNHSELTSVTIPNSVTDISHYAFYGCSRLTSITIPSGVTYVGIGAFERCTGLTEITCLAVNPPVNNEAFCGGVPLTIPVYVPCGSVADYQADNRWNVFTNIQGINCPIVTVLSSGNGTVSGGGTYIIGDTVTLTATPNCRYQFLQWSDGNTDNPRTIVVTQDTTLIAQFSSVSPVCSTGQTLNYALSCYEYTATLTGYSGICEGELIIPDSIIVGEDTYYVTSIGEDAFHNCSGLTSVTIGDSVTTISDGAFSGCTGLTSVTIGNSVTTIGDGAYRGAFSGCTNLTSLTIGNSVTCIGMSAFQGCTSLTSVNLPNALTTVSASAFYECTNLTSITIPNTVSIIRNQAFYHCTSLTSVVIGSSVSNIESWTFFGCSGVTEITCLASEPPALGSLAFYAVSSTIPVYVPCGSAAAYRAASGWSGFSNIVELGDCQGNLTDTLQRMNFTNMNPQTPYLDLQIHNGQDNAEVDTVLLSAGQEVTLSAEPTIPVKYFNGTYLVKQIPYNPVDTSFSLEGWNTRMTLPINADDRYSTRLMMSYPFYFFGQRKSGFYVGENGVITFTDNFGSGDMCPWSFSAALPWTPETSGMPSDFDRMHDAIYGVYQDLDSRSQYLSSGQGISYGIIDEYPRRTIVVNWNQIPVYGNQNLRQTSQIVAYEGTNIIEVHVKQRLANQSWQSGYGIIGIQNATGLPQVSSTNPDDPNSRVQDGAPAAFWPAGYNLTSSNFSNVSFRFIPQGESSFRYKWYRIFDDGRDSVVLATVPGDTNGYYIPMDVADSVHPALTSLVVSPTQTSRYVIEFESELLDYTYRAYDTVVITVQSGIQVSLDVNDTLMGRVHGAGSYSYGDTVTLTATPNCGHRFIQWSDGDTNNPRTLIVSGDTSIAAEFSNRIPIVCSTGQTLYYTLDCNNGTAVLIGHGEGCSGNVVIPSNVVVDGYSYPVVTIDHAFYQCVDMTSVEIPSTVVSIADYAFCGCSGLTSVTIPNSVTNLGYRAFETSGLITVTIPNSVITIGRGAFESCHNLQSVVIPNSVNVIDWMAFYGCNSMTSVVFPDSISAIGNEAFSLCSSLRSLTFPATVTSIGAYAFRLCNSLTSIRVLSENPPTLGPSSNTFLGVPSDVPVYVPCGSVAAYQENSYWSRFTNIQCLMDSAIVTVVAAEPAMGTVQGGGIYSVGDTATLTAMPNCGYRFTQWSDGHTDNPRSVILTGDTTLTAQFETGNTTVSLVCSTGQTLTYALDCSTGTATVTGYVDTCIGAMTIPDSIDVNGNRYAVTTIGYDAFGECNGITSVVIPGTVTRIGNRAFCNCKGLTSVSIPNSVTVIEEVAFGGCDSLTGIFIPASVDSIGFNIFTHCHRLASIVVDGNNPVFDSRNNCNAVIHTATNTLVSGCMSTVIPSTVSAIGQYAFWYCVGLSTVTIPEGVTTIPAGVFWGCENLTTATIPSTVTSIGEYAFYYCTSLSSLTLPSALTSLGDHAFQVCWSIDTVRCYATVPPAFGEDALYTWMPLMVPCGSESAYSTANGWSYFSDIQGIGCATGDTAIVTVVSAEPAMGSVQGGGIYSVGDTATLTAMPNCGYRFTQWSDGYTDNPRSIILTGDTTLTAQFETGNTTVSLVCSTGQTLTYELDCYYSSAWVTGYVDTCYGALVIPDSITYGGNTYMVRWIGDSAFANCNGLTSINIGNSITSIGNWAFSGCSGLTSLTTGNTVTNISNYAFSGCSGLTSLTLGNSVATIGEDAFGGCVGLTSVTIPNSVTEVYNRAFVGCSGLASIIVSSGNPVYDSRDNCNAIIHTQSNALIVGCKNTIIPNTVTSLSWGSFTGCSSLISISIPNSVTSIGADAFWGCSGMTSVTIGSSVDSIAGTAFVDCFNLTTITSLAIVPPTITGGRVFYSYPTLVVPCQSVAAYRAANGWGDIPNIQGMGCLYSQVTAISFDDAIGIALGSGSYQNGDTVTLMALPFQNTAFAGWSGGVSDNPYRFVVQGDTTVMAYFVPMITDTVYVHDTTTVTDTIVTPCPSADTTIINFYQYDTTLVNVYDTTIVNVYDTVIRNVYQYDTTIVNNYAYDTSIYNHFRYDTTLVYDTMVVNVYTYDTSIYNNYRYDTVILNTYQYDTTIVYDTTIINTYQYDTTLVNVYDTVINNYYQYDTTLVYDTTIVNTYQYDTTLVNVYDTVIRNVYQYDTTIVNNYAYDTSIYNHFRYDTTLVYDTMIVNVYTYDTSIYNNYRYDTVILNTYQYDTTIVYDTTIINTYQYDTTLVNVFDTVINNYYRYDTTMVYDTTIINTYQYDTTLVNIYDTVIRNVYQYDTTIVNNYAYDTSIYNHFRYDTTLVYDTMIVNVYTYDTSIYNNYRYDTVILNTYQYDTTLVNVYDTTIYNTYQYDTTLVNVYDTVINNYYRYDTTMVYDTTIVNTYQYDTTIVYDTVINNLYQYDTTLVNVYDTVINNYYQYDTTIVFDTTIVNVYDTTIINVYDTTINNNYVYDTIIVNNYVYDTVIVNHHTYDTVNNYYHDTVNNYYYDTVIITHYYHDTVIINNYIYDTIYLYRYLHDTIYIHDTIFVGGEGIGDVKMIDAKIYARDGQIVVEGAEGMPVVLYDAVGRLLVARREDTHGDAPLRFDVPASGVYLVKIGTLAARKVVVMR